MSSTEILKIAHMLCLSFFVGGQLFYLFIVQPASYRFFNATDQVQFLQNLLKRQNPILLFALCLVVLTGGFMITPLKGALGQSYFSAFGTKLIVKLSYFFLVFFITAYQTLGLGFKIRYLNPYEPDDVLQSTLSKLRTQMTITSLLNIGITVYIIYIARNL